MPEIPVSDPRNKNKPSSFDYETEDYCDSCNDLDHSKPKKLGIMHHARGATGRICEVMFLCHSCDNAHAGVDQ
jgi:hypothetical protein